MIGKASILGSAPLDPHIAIVILRGDLDLGRREHGLHRETDGPDRESGGPVIAQDIQADVAVAVDVFMNLLKNNFH